MYPYVYICVSEGVHLRLATEGKNIFIYYLLPNFYTYISEYIFHAVYISYNRNNLTWRHKIEVHLYSSKHQKVLLPIQWIFLILLSLFITSHSRGTCASVEIMKRYMFRERLGTTAFSHIRVKISGICYFKHQSKRWYLLAVGHCSHYWQKLIKLSNCWRVL